MEDMFIIKGLLLAIVYVFFGYKAYSSLAENKKISCIIYTCLLLLTIYLGVKNKYEYKFNKINDIVNHNIDDNKIKNNSDTIVIDGVTYIKRL